MSEGPKDALRVERLRTEGFRNLGSLSFAPGPHFNVISGENGAGKSNLLEVLGYLTTLDSFRDAAKDDLIGREQAVAQLEASFASQPLPHTVKITLSRAAPRVVTLDGKRPSSLGGFFAALQLVLFHPGHVELMRGGPELRRNLLDRTLSQLDASYSRLCAEYGKALRSRNRLLKAERVDVRAVRAYDELLSGHGARIGQARMRLTEELAPLTEQRFAEITEQALPLRLSYAPRHEPSQEVLRRALEDSLAKDLARGFTGVGPHGDDLRALASGTALKHFASQGQHRALVLAFKVAELSVLAAHRQKLPILILDDVSSELDRTRNRRFFQLLGRLGGQVFLSTTHPEHIALDHDRCDFRVEEGRVSQL